MPVQEQILLVVGFLLFLLPDFVQRINQNLLHMELVNDLFRIGEVFPDTGQVALGHVASNSSNVGSLSTMPFKLLPHGGYCFLLAAVLDIEDAALHRINGDGHIIMTTLTGCFIDCQFGNVAQFKRFYCLIHPV